MQEKVEPTRPQMSEADRACKVAPSPFPSFGKLLELPVLNIGLAPQDDLEQHGLLSQVQVVVGMGTLDGLGLCALAQAFQPILPKGLQHAEARLPCLGPALLQQAFVKKPAHAFQHLSYHIRERSANRLFRLQGTASDEDAETAEEALLLGGEQVVAPLDGIAQRLLAGGRILDSSRQDLQAVTQAGQQRLVLTRESGEGKLEEVDVLHEGKRPCKRPHERLPKRSNGKRFSC